MVPLNMSTCRLYLSPAVSVYKVLMPVVWGTGLSWRLKMAELRVYGWSERLRANEFCQSEWRRKKDVVKKMAHHVVVEYTKSASG